MKVSNFWQLRKSLIAQLCVLSAAFIVFIVVQFVALPMWKMASNSPVNYAKGRASAILLTAFQENPEDISAVANHPEIKAIASVNQHFRYYFESSYGVTRFGKQPETIKFPELRNPIPSSYYQIALEENKANPLARCSQSGSATLPFMENGAVGSIIVNYCPEPSPYYMEIAGIAASPFSATQIYRDQLQAIGFGWSYRYLVASLGVFLIALFFVARSAYSVQRLAKLTTNIDPDRKGVRLPPSGDGLPLEITPLVHSLNRLLARIEDVAEKRRLFLSSAAHEMRTPLTILQARLEKLPDSPEKLSAKAGLQDLIRMTEQLLGLTRAIEQDEIALAPVNLNDIARDVCASRVPIARSRDIEIELHHDQEKIEILGSQHIVSTAISNLIDNALSFSKPGDTINVTIDCNGVLTVRDNGPGLQAEAQETIFEPFVKHPPNRQGQGLGLAIVKALMELLRGQTEARNAPGGGAIFCLRFIPVEQ